MAPGVPFAALAGVQLLSVAAALGLAGAAMFPRLRRPTTPLLVLGALTVAGADTLTAVRFGSATDQVPAGLRIAGLALVAVGLAGGALSGPRPRAEASSGAAPVAGLASVVVPLGLTPNATIATIAAAAAAALGALRVSPAAGRRRFLLSAAFVATAGAAAAGPAARDSVSGAYAVLALRGLAALLILAVLAVLTRTSVLARVVAAILGGVLVMAVGAVAVGGAVAGSVQRQQADQVGQVASSQVNAIEQLVLQAGSFARVVAACPDTASNCTSALQAFGTLPGEFAAKVPQAGTGNVIQFPVGPALSPSAVLALQGEPIVQAVLAGVPSARQGGSTLTILDGQVVVLGVAPTPTAPGAKPQYAAVYGGRLDSSYARSVARSTTYDLTLLIRGKVSATSLPAKSAAVLSADAATRDLPDALATGSGGVTTAASGNIPTIGYRALTAADNQGAPVAVLAASQPADVALRAERQTFAELFLTALGVMVVAALLALVMGGRGVAPIRRLTDTANRIRRGDLSVRTGVRGADEVGVLARAFDQMTDSLVEKTQDLRAAAEEQSALRARLETVLSSMSDGLVATGPDGFVMSINPAACALAGRSADDVVGRPFTEALPLVDDSGRHVALSRAGDVLLRRPDGSAVAVQVAAAPLDGDPTRGLAVVLRDTSREREVERMKTDFLSNVSHELRTPLTPIRGYAEMLRSRPTLDAETRTRFADTIVDCSNRMARVVDLLVDVAAMEAGRVQPHPSPQQVSRLVDDRLDAWRASRPERADDLRRRVTSGLPEVEVDGYWVAKALDELIDNALKHTPAGTPVTLVASEGPRGRVRVGVRDAGPGIAEEALPGIFLDFQQVDGSSTRSVGGLGLGLSFVRRVATTLGFGLEATSTPGKGSEFSLDLPVASRRARRARNGEARPGLAGRRAARR